MKNLAANLLRPHMSDLTEPEIEEIIKNFSEEVIDEFEILTTTLGIGADVKAQLTSSETGRKYVLNIKVEYPDPVEEEEAIPIKTNNKA